MSKKYPEDIDYREATPCLKCGCVLECFNVAKNWMACPNCEAPAYKQSRAIMRIDDIHLDCFPWGDVVASLKAGPETIKTGTVKELVMYVIDNGLTCDGINYSLYQKMRDEQHGRVTSHCKSGE